MAIYYGDSSNSTAGRVVQVVSATKTDTATYNSIGQGAETSIPFVCSITPKDNNNKILVIMQITCDMSTTHSTYATLKRQIAGAGYTEPFVGDSNGNRHRVTSGQSDQRSNSLRNINLMYLDSPNNTNQVDYGFTLSHNDNSTVNILINYVDSDDDNSYNGRGTCSITCMEIAV